MASNDEFKLQKNYITFNPYPKHQLCNLVQPLQRQSQPGNVRDTEYLHYQCIHRHESTPLQDMESQQCPNRSKELLSGQVLLSSLKSVPSVTLLLYLKCTKILKRIKKRELVQATCHVSRKICEHSNEVKIFLT